VSVTETKNPPRKASQAPLAKKAARLKAASKAKRPKPEWLVGRAQVLPAKPEGEAPPPAPPRLLSKAEVLALTGVTYPCLWEWMRADPPRFPRSRVIGRGGNSKSVWLSSEIDDWMQRLPVRRLKGDKVGGEGAA
jgi:predicted DNA-binding transcriptional regulator AlpA